LFGRRRRPSFTYLCVGWCITVPFSLCSVPSNAGARQARGEVGLEVGVQGIQSGVLAAEGHQPGDHQIVPQQGRRADGGSPVAGPRRTRQADSDFTPLKTAAAARPAAAVCCSHRTAPQ